MRIDIEYPISNMTVEEKAVLCSGEGMRWTKAVERQGLPRIMMSDGPNGLRKEATGVENVDGPKATVTAIGYPTGSAIASPFDRVLLQKEGELLGEETALTRKAATSVAGEMTVKSFPSFTKTPRLQGRCLQEAEGRGVTGR